MLLKNNGILPLKNVKKIALIGPNADNFDILIANYNGDPIIPITPLTGLRKKLGASNVLYAPGCPIVDLEYSPIMKPWAMKTSIIWKTANLKKA